MVKKITVLVALPLLVIFMQNLAFASGIADTLPLNLKIKVLKPVKIGPENFLLPVIKPVDSVLLRKLAIDAGYKKKVSEESAIRYYQDNQLLNLLLSNAELYAQPVAQNITLLASLLNSFRYAEDLRNQVLVLNSLSLYYVKIADPGKALPYLLQALQLQEQQLKDKQAIARLANCTAGVYKLLANYDNAIKYYEYAARVNLELKRTTEVATAYTNIATVKSFKKEFTDAEYYLLRKALPLFRGNKEGRMNCFHKLAEVYLIQNRFSEAKWYFLQENQIANFLNDHESQVSSLISLAQIKNVLGDHIQALNDFREAELLASQNRYIDRLAQIKGDLGGIYLKLGDYTAAGTAIDEYSQLKNTLFNSSK